ncbi:MAG: fibronectin type III domain-containing protein [Ignavibacteriales bacterium]|nr:fibronectin type III domain-containing protein [Ignavibacteriales bacterium]
MGAYGGTKYSPYLPTNLAPSTPKNLIAIAGNGMVTLKWNKNTENDVLRYRIYIGTDSNSVSLKDSSASILDTVKIVTGLPNGAIYYFRVSAMNNLRLESGKSYAVSVTIPNVQSPTITLTSPIGGELWNEDHTHPIQYQASDQVGVTRIKILYSTNGGQTYTTIVDSTRNSGFCNWTVPRIPSTLAKVKVIAYNAQGFSASDSSHANFIICDVSSYVHATGALSLTVRNDGTIGTTDSLRRFTEPSMEYPPGSNKHHLYLGELVIATIRGTDTITTSLYGDYFTPVGLVTAINHGSYIETQSHFIDKMYLGLDLTQRTFGIAGQASVIVSYSIKNTGTTSFPAFYVGFHTDFDLNNPALNLPGFDVVNKLGYMYDAQGGWTSYAGIRLLDRSIGGFKRILGTEGFPTPGDFYRRMTAAGNDNTSSDVQADHRIIEMLPAVNLPIGESTTVTFALAAGAGLTGLQTASQQAQTQWTQINVAAPTPPRNLTAIAGNGQVTLRWNKNTEADFLKYFVYMGSDSITMSLKDSTSGGINDTVHSITQLLNGTKYYFRVTALNSARSESAQSYAVSATPKVPTVIVPIGTGTITDRHIPVEPYYGYSYSQVIYLASEINNFGNIVTLQWYFSGSSLSSSNNWTIYLGHTTKTAFNSSTDWIPLSSLTQVYSGSFSSPSESGWITFDITDFAYNGLDNLVVAVDENASDFNSSSDDFYCTSVSNTRSIYYYNDSDNIDPSSPPAGTTQSYIANIQVGIFQPLIMPPQNLTAAAGDGQVTLKWNKNKEADLLRYRIYCGTSPHPTTKVDSSTASNLDTTKIIIGLTNGTTYYFRVTAINNTGLESGYSNEVSATPKPEENILRLSPFAVSSLYLNEQIAADTLRNGKLSNRVYILQRGGVYRVNTSIMNYNWTLRIRANDSTTTQKPIIFLYPSPTTGVLPAQFINVSGDVELKNLIVSGYYELADTNLRSLQGTLLRVTTTSGWKIVIDSCILSNAMNHIRTEVAASVIKVTNTVFANMGYLGKSNVGAGRVFDFREVSIDSLIIQNCTFVNSLDRIIRHVGITSPYTTSPIKYILFDHNTLVNGTGYHGILAFGNVSDRSIITNNLLFDAFALGNDTDYTRQLSPEFASSGEKDRYDRNRITWIYSEPNQTAQWTISNNYYGISDSGRAFYNQYASAGVTGEGSPLTWHINSRLGADSIGAFKKIWIVPSKVPALMTELMRWYRSPSGGNKTKNTPAAWIYGDVNTHPYADPFDYDRKGYSWLQDSLNCSYYSSVKPSSTDGKVVGDSRWNFKGIVSDPYALPAAPQNLTAIAGNGQVTLRWSKNIEADFLKYRIYRGTTSGGETLVDSSSASITDTIKTISGLTNEQIYYFHITAMNTARLESGYSNEVSATPTNNPVLSVNPATLSFSSLIVSTTSPEKTYSLSGANLSPATGNITVTAPTAFEVSLTSGSGFTSSINASYTNGTLSTTVYVHFKPISLIAYSGNISNSGGGATAQSVSVSGTGIQQITIPAAPTNLSASVISGSQINLSWTDVSNNEDGFKIERKIGTSGIYSLRVTLGENVQSYSDTGLAELTTYYYRIYAYNTGGSSEYANEAYAITKDTTAPSAPTAVQISPSIWTNQNKFDIAWTNPSDPSGIAKVWYTIDVVPTVAQPGTGVGITQAQLQVTLAAGTNSGKHTIYMYLEDGANNKDPNKIANVIVRYDNNKPAITDNSTLPTVTVENGNASPQVIITCSATDGAGESGVQSFVLQYIRVGDTQIDSNSINAPFDVTTNKQIPTSVFVSSDGKAKGVSYRLKAVDTAGNATSTLWKSIVVQNASTVTINTPTTFPAASNYASTEIVKAYRIFSIPYDLNDKRPVDFIPQSLGDHASNGINYYNWRLQRYVNGVKQDYEDFKNDLTAAAPGNGFFLIVRDPQKKISIGPNKEVPADLMNNTGISLANGWNLVGTPLNMDIKFDSLVFSGGTYADRAYYDGAGSVSGWHKSGANIDVMKAWEGLAIKMNGAGTMRFRTLGPQLRVGEKDGIYGKTITAGAQVLSKTAMNWIVSVDAYRSDIGMRCEGNSIGMAQDARDGQDAYDSFMPPFVGDRNVAVYFQNPDGAMMRDIRPLNDDGGVWDMRVITGDAAAKVKLQFGDVMNLPNPQFEAFVIDIDQRMAYNLKDVSKIEINSGNGARNLRVVVGKKLYIEQNNAGVELYPTTMKLFANYPNPFNPETIIRYTVPNASPSYTVILKIFNVLGQEITTLINAQQKSGYYEVKYAAQNQSSGVYFYQINVSDGMQVFKDVKKMVLMK